MLLLQPSVFGFLLRTKGTKQQTRQREHACSQWSLLLGYLPTHRHRQQVPWTPKQQRARQTLQPERSLSNTAWFGRARRLRTRQSSSSYRGFHAHSLRTAPAKRSKTPPVLTSSSSPPTLHTHTPDPPTRLVPPLPVVSSAAQGERAQFSVAGRLESDAQRLRTRHWIPSLLRL